MKTSPHRFRDLSLDTPKLCKARQWYISVIQCSLSEVRDGCLLTSTSRKRCVPVRMAHAHSCMHTQRQRHTHTHTQQLLQQNLPKERQLITEWMLLMLICMCTFSNFLNKNGAFCFILLWFVILEVYWGGGCLFVFVFDFALTWLWARFWPCFVLCSLKNQA